MWKLTPDKPRVCYCRPGHCGAPKPQWCIGKRADEHPELVTCPPGLLLSLGDGTAVERSVEDLARAMCVGKDPDEMISVVHYKVGENASPPRVEPRWKLEIPKAKAIVAALIQQAQEKRDV